jgi:hypothetical protein
MTKGDKLIVRLLLFIVGILVGEVVRGDTTWEKYRIDEFEREFRRNGGEEDDDTTKEGK